VDPLLTDQHELEPSHPTELLPEVVHHARPLSLHTTAADLQVAADPGEAEATVAVPQEEEEAMVVDLAEEEAAAVVEVEEDEEDRNLNKNWNA
jgi:hypothetical protein